MKYSILVAFLFLFVFSACNSNDDDCDTQAQQDFLIENRDQPGVTETDSGLQYKVLDEGTEELSPSADDRVEVHYSGRTIDGEVFDSSYDRGETAEFSLNGVIPGFSEGIQLMNVGDTYELYIPGNLAYGNRPPPNSIICPNGTLIFEVELIQIVE